MSFKVTIPIDEPLKNIITLFNHVSTSVLLEFEDDERLAWKTCSTDKSIAYVAYMEPESFHMGGAEGSDDIDPNISHVKVDLNPITFNAQLLFLHVLHSAVLQGSRIELDINLALPYVPFNILGPDGNTMEVELDQETIDEDFPEHFRDGTFHGTRVEQPGFAKLLEFNDPQHTIRRLELPTILLRSLVLFSSSLEILSDGEEHGIPFIAWRTILLIYYRNCCNGIFTFRYAENDENAGNIEGEFRGLRLSLDQLPFPLQTLGMAKRVTIENAPFIVSMQVGQHLCLRIYIPSNAAVCAQGDCRPTKLSEDDVASVTSMNATRTFHELLYRYMPTLPTPMDVPDHLIPLILSYLPVKPLQRFKLVCKAWNNIITDSGFKKIHMSRECNSFLLTKQYNSTAYCIWDIANRPRTYKLLLPADVLQGNTTATFRGCCQGIILIYYRTKQYNLVLYNPGTRVSHRVPPPRCRKYDSWSLGVDKYTEEYQIVGLPDSILNPAIVYRLSLDSWNKSPLPINHYGIRMGETSGGTANNCINWLVVQKMEENEIVITLLSFDLHHRKWKLLPLPQIVEQNPLRPHLLGVLDDTLVCLVDMILGKSEVWMMNDCTDGSSWSKLFVMPNADNFMLPVCRTLEEDGYKYLLTDHSKGLTNHSKGLTNHSKGLAWYKPNCQIIEEITIDREADEFLKQESSRELLVCCETLYNPFP